MYLKKILFAVSLLAIFKTGYAQKGQPINLYPNGVPNSKPAPKAYAEKYTNDWTFKVTQPTLTPFFPVQGKANGTAIIVMPGGGYAGLAIDHEGYVVAQKFADMGITAFVLKYRLPNDTIMPNRAIGPLQDAQRAMQMVREKAAEWKLDVNKIGIIGFSAGGHLASTLGTHYAQAVIDNKANTNLRPDFMILMYPVITMGELTHQGSKENLIGKAAPAEEVNLYSNEKQVNAQTPPAFLVHAQDDDVVPVMNSVMFYEAMLKAGAKVEMHLYQAGGHGFGLNNPATKDQWFDRCLNWLTANKFISK